MKKILKIAAFITAGLVTVFFASKTIRSFTVPNESAQLQTDHFTITYHGIYESEAQEVSAELEANYDRIREGLNDPEHDVIKVFIHPNQQEFNKATGLLHSSANGTSRGPLEFHFIWTNWFNSIFPDNPKQTAVHEFTHCVQLNILINEAIQTLNHEDEESFNAAFENKFSADYPQWLWEAISTYEAKELNTISVKYGMRGNPTLQELSSSNQVYNVGYTIIEYLVDKWGKNQLPELIRSYGDFKKVLGVSEADFEKGWHKYVNENY
jgi:hypothetical protein